MKIRFTNPFLATVGTALIIGSIFITKSATLAFVGGSCFGLIFLDIYKSRN